MISHQDRRHVSGKLARALKYGTILAAALSAGQVAAEEAARFAIEEVVVTATKRGAQSLQEVPFAVQAVGAEDLAMRGAMDFKDFFRLVPGLAVYDQGPGDKRYIIRGVNAVGAGTVGIYLDEVIVTGENAQDGGGRQPDIKLFDIDRIEVLKGPQGTTFGSSSLSGTIRYITRKPELDELSASVGGSLRVTKGSDVGWHAEGMVNAPLAEDKAAIRIAAYALDSKGWISNRLAEDVNNEETYAARISARVKPTEALTIDLMAMYQDGETGGPSYLNRVDYEGNPITRDFFQADVVRAGFQDESQIYNATIEYAADHGTVTGTASLFKRETVFDRDASLVMDAFLNLPYDGDGRSIISQPKDHELQSYELRYASSFSGPFQILAGAFYQKEKRDFRSAIFSAGPDGRIEANPRVLLDRRVRTTIDQLAFFGEVSLDITDRLTVTGGARYYDFEIDEVANAVKGIGGAPGAGVGPLLKSGEDGVIFKGNISYDLTDDAHVYFQVAEGFRSGGTNDQTAAQLANVVIPAGFGSDSLINYEVGLKSSFLDRRVYFNASAYLIDWSDIQIQDQATDGTLTFPFRSNGGAAKIKGLEIELTTYPMEGLQIGLTANFSDAKLTEDNPIPSTGRDGDAITYVPDTTLSLTAQYEWPLWGDVMGQVGGDVSYVGSRNTEFRPDNPLFMKLEDYALVNLRAGVVAADWSATLVVNNLFNDNSVVDVYRIQPGVTPDGYLVNVPRSFILSFAKHF